MNIFHRLWTHWLNRKHELLALTIIITVSLFASKAIAIQHWHSLDWIVPGVSPFAPYFSMLIGLAVMGTLYLRRVKSPGLWILGASTFFFGCIMFWIMEGPLVGSLILSKDGKRYVEFNTASFRYVKQHYAKEYDFFYPSELEVIAFRGKEKLQLRFKMTVDSREYVSRFSDGKYWRGFVICEAPGVVEGHYFDGEKETHLTGICRMEPQRQVSILGHNSITIDFLKPPKGFGVSFELDSHYLKKKMYTKLQLAPRPKIKMNLKRTDDSKKNKKQSNNKFLGKI